MINLQDKINLLQERYRGEKEKIYFQEIIMNHPQIIVQDFKKGQTQLSISNKCYFCSQRFFKYYSILKEVKNQSNELKTSLCTHCVYRILSNKSQKLKIQYFEGLNNAKITAKVNQILHQAPKPEGKIQTNGLDDDSWANQLDGYSLNFEQQQDDLIQLASSKKYSNPEANGFLQDKQETISSKQSSHRYSQQQKVKIQESSSQTSPNSIFQLLQKISLSKTKEINPITLVIKLIVFQNIQKQQKKSGLHQSNYLNYFEKNILRQIICKTYNQQDRIKKNEIEFIYQFWIKSLKKHLETNYQTKIREYNNRNVELSKKIIMRDRKIAEINKDSKMQPQFIGFKKNGPKWNQIIRQLRLRLFNFQKLKDIRIVNSYI